MKNRILTTAVGFAAVVAIGSSAALAVKNQEIKEEMTQLRSEMHQKNAQLVDTINANQGKLDKASEKISKNSKDTEAALKSNEKQQKEIEELKKVKQIAQERELSAVQSESVENNTRITQMAPADDSGSIQTHNGFTVSSMKEAIAMSESGGDYNARNGRYIGKFQLDESYLGGDYSPENQERVFEEYVNDRYGGIAGAWEHWKAYGWY